MTIHTRVGITYTKPGTPVIVEHDAVSGRIEFRYVDTTGMARVIPGHLVLRIETI